MSDNLDNIIYKYKTKAYEEEVSPSEPSCPEATQDIEINLNECEFYR